VSASIFKFKRVCILSRYDTSGIGIVRAESLLKKLGIEFRESKTPSSSIFASLNGKEEIGKKKSVSVDSARKSNVINLECNITILTNYRGIMFFKREILCGSC